MIPRISLKDATTNSGLDTPWNLYLIKCCFLHLLLACLTTLHFQSGRLAVLAFQHQCCVWHEEPRLPFATEPQPSIQQLGVPVEMPEFNTTDMLMEDLDVPVVVALKFDFGSTTEYVDLHMFMFPNFRDFLNWVVTPLHYPIFLYLFSLCFFFVSFNVKNYGERNM